MILYMDSSALVKLYVWEPGSDRVRALVAQADACATSAIAYAEIRAAMARRHREGVLNSASLNELRSALLDDWQNLFVVPVLLPIAKSAGDAAELYALRSMDAIHLATAQWLQKQQDGRVTVAAWDIRLTSAATLAGMPVEGPNAQ